MEPLSACPPKQKTDRRSLALTSPSGGLAALAVSQPSRGTIAYVLAVRLVPNYGLPTIARPLPFVPLVRAQFPDLVIGSQAAAAIVVLVRAAAKEKTWTW
jgi:hypothetical protein